MKYRKFNKVMALLVTLLMVFPFTGVTEGLTIESENSTELGEISLCTPEDCQELSGKGRDIFAEDTVTDFATVNCSHRQMYVLYDTEGKEQAKSVDNQYHKTTVKVKNVELCCRDCGETIDTYYVNRNVSVKRFHDYIWDPDHIKHCSQCGRTRSSCSHSRYKTYSAWTDREYVNENYHLILISA